MKNPDLLSLSPDAPVVMSVINVTPDSFYKESCAMDKPSVYEHIARAVAEGATILDIGGCSSRPGAGDIPAAEQIARLSPAMEVVAEDFSDIFVSIDTFSGEVAAAIVERFGRCIINDISAGEIDPAILDVAAKNDLPYIAMHMRGTPRNMQQMTDYDNITDEVGDWFDRKIALLRSRGINNIILDPGFGFAKTTAQNYELLRNMAALRRFGYPLLAGLSRKSMIFSILGVSPSEAFAGTVALGWEALRQGTSVLRVHDTLPAAQTIELYKLMYLCDKCSLPSTE